MQPFPTRGRGQATLEKMLFPVKRPGDFNTAEWELFFSFCHFFFFLKISTFSYQKQTNRGIKDFAAARLATVSATRWTGNKLFLRVASGYQPIPVIVLLPLGLGLPPVGVESLAVSLK